MNNEDMNTTNLSPNNKASSTHASNKFLNFVKEYAYIPITILAAFIFAGVIFVFGIIPSASMEPTYMTNSIFMGNRLVKASEFQRGDPIIFHYDEKQIYLKRVIGLPGDKVTFNNGFVYINGEKYDESEYLDASVDTFPETGREEFVVPENAYFVMGDNRHNSYDSRYWREADGHGPYVYFDDVIGTMIGAFKIPFVS